MNLYGFADGDAVNFSDPMGLNPVPLLAGAAVFVAYNWRVIAAAGSIGIRGGRIMNEARKILSSPQMETLRQASVSGEEAVVQIGSRSLSYVPSLPGSAMTSAGRGFHLGPQAFSSQSELSKTVLHELHRLGNSASVGSGASSSAAAAETQAAAAFADKAHALGKVLRFWK